MAQHEYILTEIRVHICAFTRPHGNRCQSHQFSVIKSTIPESDSGRAKLYFCGKILPEIDGKQSSDY